MAPGRYPYIPDRTYEYYVNLSGGFDQNRHSGSKVIITDINNNRITNTQIIEPETRIVAPNNNPLFIFSQVASIVSAVTSIVIVILSSLQQ